MLANGRRGGLGRAGRTSGAHRGAGRCRAIAACDRAAGRTARSAGGPRPVRSSTHDSPTAPVSQRSWRRWRSTVRCWRSDATSVGHSRSTAFAAADGGRGAAPSSSTSGRTSWCTARPAQARPPSSTRWQSDCPTTSASSPSRTSPSCGWPGTTSSDSRPDRAPRTASAGPRCATSCAAALRLRPDRIVVGEVRGAEAADMVWALSTGHRGGFSTCHAGGPGRRAGPTRDHVPDGRSGSAAPSGAGPGPRPRSTCWSVSLGIRAGVAASLRCMPWGRPAWAIDLLAGLGA